MTPPSPHSTHLPEVDRVLISRDDIRRRVAEMGAQLADELAGELSGEGDHHLSHADRVVMVPILTGAMVFAADLVREMPLRLSIRLVAVSSYPGQTTASKGASLRSALPTDLAGRHVVIIDDILDSGQTLHLVRNLINEHNPSSVRTCVLLKKDVPRDVDVPCEMFGFSIPDEFVVGYGLDFNEYYRNLECIGVLDPKIYS